MRLPFIPVGMASLLIAAPAGAQVSQAADAKILALVSAFSDARDHFDAIVIGSVDYAVPDPSGMMVKRTVRVTYVERRVGGRWLMASAQYTGLRPPRPTQ